jgi:hypothetical protein
LQSSFAFSSQPLSSPVIRQISCLVRLEPCSEDAAVQNLIYSPRRHLCVLSTPPTESLGSSLRQRLPRNGLAQPLRCRFFSDDGFGNLVFLISKAATTSSAVLSASTRMTYKIYTLLRRPPPGPYAPALVRRNHDTGHAKGAQYMQLLSNAKAAL